MLCGPRKGATSTVHILYLGGDFTRTKNILAGSATMITPADADAAAARDLKRYSDFFGVSGEAINGKV
jgi:hypothetical protein